MGGIYHFTIHRSRYLQVIFIFSAGYGWRPDMGTYVWIPGSHGSVPPGAVVAGKDVDGSTLYAGRAFHEGDILPAKISPSHGGAMVAHGGSEHTKHEYEVQIIKTLKRLD